MRISSTLKRRRANGFTLIEMSIVLVIIGLIVGGVLVGQDLIRAAAVRATISQIEKYQTAVNTFRGKYGALPGDMNASTATTFGFLNASLRGGAAEGDGNGVIQGAWYNGSEFYTGSSQSGESAMFWEDLSTANLVDGTFNTATPLNLMGSSCNITGTTTPSLSSYFPPAKIGSGNYVIIIWNGGNVGWSGIDLGDGLNYFSVGVISPVTCFSNYWTPPAPTPGAQGLTVSQAYNIDRKVDDGLPQSGAVQAFGPQYAGPIAWAGGYNSGNWAPCGNGGACGPWTTATPGSSTSCFDNSATNNGTPGVSGVPQHYSMEINNGAGVNCALSFRFQ